MSKAEILLPDRHREQDVRSEEPARIAVCAGLERCQRQRQADKHGERRGENGYEPEGAVLHHVAQRSSIAAGSRQTRRRARGHPVEVGLCEKKAEVG
jgi:hypothetical protein